MNSSGTRRDLGWLFSLCVLIPSLGACTGGRSLGSVDAAVGIGVAYDECGNGMDEDLDGIIDENCPCSTTESQNCFGGRYPHRLIGRCRDGEQRCESAGADDEFGSWGSCLGDMVPAQERCDGILDDNCDGAIDEGCACEGAMSRVCGTEYAAGICRPGQQVCRDDGLWSGCIGAVGPGPELCSDELDNDCDGLVNEACECLPAPERCGDGVDNDCDGQVDEPGCHGECVVRSTHVVDLVADQDHVCALIDDGRVFCWGDNTLGSLGIGEGAGPRMVREEIATSTGIVIVDRDISPSPLQVPGLTGVTNLSASMLWSTCALDGRSQMRCFGPNFEPSTQLGGETYWVPTVPPETAGLEGLVQVAAGRVAKFALDDAGQVWAWGEIRHEILGTELASSWNVGEPAVAAGVPGTSGFDTLAETSCAIVEGGRVSCWGANNYGQAGDPAGAADRRVEPTALVGIEDADVLALGESHGCAMQATGRVSCWGANGNLGQSERGASGFSAEAVLVEGLIGIVAIEASYNATCAIASDGSLLCWGPPPSYRLPGETNSRLAGTVAAYPPAQVEGASNVIDVAFSGIVDADNIDANGRLLGTLCVLERCGRVRCMGRNVLGQLGDGTTNDSLEFIEVVGLP